MTAQEFIKALKRLGYTPYSAAPHIGVSVRQSLRYASGESNIPEPVAKLIRLLLEQPSISPNEH